MNLLRSACHWADCHCREWPPVRLIMSTGQRYTVEAGPHLGQPWLYFYRYMA